MFYRFAVIGNPVSHSLSPIIHQYFAQQFDLRLTYGTIKAHAFSFERQVSDFFASGGKGLNVTLPFKEKAFAMAQIKTLRCELAGSANTLWMKEGKLHADNTDGAGFIRDLTRYRNVQGKHILLLGAGGAARGILNPLLAAEPEYLLVANRSRDKVLQLSIDFPEIKYSALNNIVGKFEVVINATSASLEENPVILPEACMQQKPFCYDLAYKLHQPTAFVQYAASMDCDAVDGLGMLVEQAAEAFYIWHGLIPATEPVLKMCNRSRGM